MSYRRELKHRKMGGTGFSKRRQLLRETHKGSDITLGKLSNYWFDINFSSGDFTCITPAENEVFRKC